VQLKKELDTVSQPPTASEKGFDRAFRVCTWVFAWLTILLMAYILIQLSWDAGPAIQKYGVGFLTDASWDTGREDFGILPMIWGTLYSSLLGLVIGTVFGVAIAIFLSQEFLPPKVELIFKNIIELLAAIPSVVYGLWGIFVVVPAIRPVADWLFSHLSWIPFFSTSLSGRGMLPAAIVLAIMILPTISAISRDALVSVPGKLKEAAYGLGATRWEAILHVIVPTAATGIFGSIVLAFGRALGETMALAMLVGNANVLSLSLFSPGNTLAALLANNFPEAKGVELQVLMYAALVLLAITLIVNILGEFVLQRAARATKGLN
jgi:phosphate transport system permease protein